MSYRERMYSSKSIAVGETYSFDFEKPLSYGAAIELTIRAGSGESVYSFTAGKPATQQILTGVVVTYDPMRHNGRLTVENGYSTAVGFRSVAYTVDNDAYMFGPYKQRINVKQVDLDLGTMTEAGGKYSTTPQTLYQQTLDDLGITKDYSLAAVLVAHVSNTGLMPDARDYHAPFDISTSSGHLYPYVEMPDNSNAWTIHYTTANSALQYKRVWAKMLFVNMPEGVSV